MTSRMLALADEPSVATPMISDRPTASAPAVSAVRFGLRAALRPAIVPAAPRSLPSAGDDSRAIGPATNGPSAMSAVNSAATPTPSQRASPPRPAATEAMAISTLAPPTTLRFIETSARSMATSRMAASGGTRPDRMAGTTAQSMVTTVPTISVMTNPVT